MPANLANYEAEVKHLTAGAGVIVSGTLVPSQGKGQAFEIQATRVEVVTALVDDPETYPIQPKQHSMEFLREVAHLRPRTNLFGAVTRMRHTVMMAIHRFLTEQGFYWINTPIITTSDAEGAGDMFRLSTLDLANLPRDDKGEIDFRKDFFGREAFLTVSGQLNVEAYCLAMSKVYTFGPTFRAENSNTPRHLAEFWMVEPEIAFADLNDNADCAEALPEGDLPAPCWTNAPTTWRSSPNACSRTRSPVWKRSFVSRSSASITPTPSTILQKSGQKFEYPVAWGVDLQTEHERYLAEKHVGRPVVVMNYPEQIKAFYMRLNDDEKTVAAMDVLAPGIGEIIGGAQREERLDHLDRRMAKFGLDPATYDWYRDLRRYGTVPHAGFGLGFERLLVLRLRPVEHPRRHPLPPRRGHRRILIFPHHHAVSNFHHRSCSLHPWRLPRRAKAAASEPASTFG